MMLQWIICKMSLRLKCDLRKKERNIVKGSDVRMFYMYESPYNINYSEKPSDISRALSTVPFSVSAAPSLTFASSSQGILFTPV
jgi:hypothetical protein